MKSLYKLIPIIFVIVFVKTAVNAQPGIDVETGAVFTGYNDVQIPGDQGTRFSLKDDLAPKTKFFYRIRLNYTIKSRHTLSLLYAPLETQSQGRVANARNGAGHCCAITPI